MQKVFDAITIALALLVIGGVHCSWGGSTSDQLINAALSRNAALQAAKVDLLRFTKYSTSTQVKLNGKLGLTATATKATALAANGSNCSAGQAAQGVDASGAAEGCFTPPGTYVLPITDSVSTTSSSTAASATAVKAANDLAATKANSAQPAWTAATLAGTWTNYNSGFAPASYFKDNFGIVHLSGLVLGGTYNTTIFTLPAGSRPAYILGLPGVVNNSAGIITITAAGVVTAQGAGGAVNLDGISFPTF